MQSKRFTLNINGKQEKDSSHKKPGYVSEKN